MHVVTGTIVFGSDLEPFTGATVHARIEEVSRTDAPARVAAESVLREVGAGGKALNWLAFTIEAPFLEPRARYVVRIHVDVDVDGQVGVGDYVSTASHPVSVGGDTTNLSIPVKRVS